MTTLTRILMVDDDISAARLLKLGLEATGTYAVREVNKPRDSLAAAREFHPDLIILDVNMPDMTGGEVAGQFRKDPLLSEVPIIFLTAIISQREAGDTGLVSGGYRFLAKPVHCAKLIEMIQTIMAGGGVH